MLKDIQKYFLKPMFITTLLFVMQTGLTQEHNCVPIDFPKIENKNDKYGYEHLQHYNNLSGLQKGYYFFSGDTLVVPKNQYKLTEQEKDSINKELVSEILSKGFLQKDGFECDTAIMKMSYLKAILESNEIDWSIKREILLRKIDEDKEIAIYIRCGRFHIFDRNRIKEISVCSKEMAIDKYLDIRNKTINFSNALYVLVDKKKYLRMDNQKNIRKLSRWLNRNNYNITIDDGTAIALYGSVAVNGVIF